MSADAREVWDFMASRDNQQRLVSASMAEDNGGKGWNQRQIDVAIKARAVIGECIGEVMSDLAVAPGGYDFTVTEDRQGFLRGLQAGAILAAIDLGGADANSDFFTALLGE